MHSRILILYIKTFCKHLAQMSLLISSTELLGRNKNNSIKLLQKIKMMGIFDESFYEAKQKNYKKVNYSLLFHMIINVKILLKM